jgi:hypothetical protein
MSTYFKEIETDDNSGNIFYKIWRYYQSFNDKIQFFRKERWISIGVLSLIFLLRIFLTEGILLCFKLGYHAVTYCLGIHLLNSFIGFISPLQDPEEEEGGMEEKGSYLPQKYNYI